MLRITDLKNPIIIFLIAFLGVMVYANSVSGDFIWDDKILVQYNDIITSIENLPVIFTKNITYGTDDVSNFYRPVQMLSYLMNYGLARLDVRAYHVTNIALHILTAVSLFLFIFLICRNRFIAAAASLLFVCHPLNTEAVAYISGRADLLVALFTLFVLVFYAEYAGTGNRSFYLTAFLFYAISLMSKETALVTPFLLAAFIYIYGNKKMFWRNSVPFFAAALIYIILRKTVLDFSSGALTVSMPLLERVLVIFDSLGKYFIKLVYPADLHMQYALILPGPVDISVILGIFLTLVMAWGAIAARKTERIVTFAIAWFFITYLPVSNVFPLNATFAEHWFYVPSMGIFMIAGWFLGKLCAGNKILKWSLSLFFVIVLGVFSYLTILQNNYWKDAEKFYKRTLEYARGAGRARIYFSLSIVYFEKGLTDEGIWALERAIKDKPDYVDARNNLATAFIMKGEYDKAIEQAEMSLGINPSSATAYYRLSVAYFHKKNYILARQSLEKAKRLGYRRVRPGYERALERLK